MPEGAETQQPFKKERESTPVYSQEVVQYQDNQLALSLTGDRGAIFDFDLHKYSPTHQGNEAIISTKSGNDYYIFTKRGNTYMVNTRETNKQGKLIAAEKAFPTQLSPVEFGEPWKIPGFYTTSEVESILLRYKMAANGHDVGRKIDKPNPFDKYISLLRKSDR